MYEVNKGYIFSEFQWLTATLIFNSYARFLSEKNLPDKWELVSKVYEIALNVCRKKAK